MTPKGLMQLEGDVPLDTSNGPVDQLEHIKFYLGRSNFSDEDLTTKTALLLIQSISNAAAFCRHTYDVEPLRGLLSISTIVNIEIIY
jgi:hypothetical protein